ncbi:uncharacterized protein [Mytilus edulis]|uniref:uncharacterized protein n=1 Tax=Mytilus edulis TaxID=6550 RepID=UPI0039EEEC68
MVTQKRNSFKSSSDSLSTWKSDLHSLKQHTSEIHLFQLVKFLDSKTYQKESEIRDIQAATVPILKYHPSESDFNISKLVPDLGTITVENIQIQMPLLDIDQQGQILVRDERQLALSHSFPTTKFGNKVTINTGCFIPNNRLLLSQFTGKQLLVCKLDGSNSSVINLDSETFNTCLYDKTHAVISLRDKDIQIIDLTSWKPGRRIRIGGVCRGMICVKDKIWVKNQPYTLTIVDINGKVLRVIQTTFDPDDICANQDGDVYCTDNNCDKVYVVTSDGKEREIYNSPDLNGAGGVAVDDHGDVYVAGFRSNNIHRISNDGQKHDIVLTAFDGIYQPTGLSYNSETKELLVMNNFNNAINIYKTQ